MQRTVQRLANDIRALEYKISILDATAFISEQECRRKEQQLQELTDKKDRLEKFIANILNGEGYSKLKQIVKAILSENKKLISISFVALLQTLKNDPEMAKLIYNIPASMNDGEKYIDDNDNITKYLEINKDRLLDFTEKHYENLVEALTNNAIDNAAVAASSSSNLSLSQPQSSSSTFPNLSNKNNIYRIEEAETYHNSEDDISD